MSGSTLLRCAVLGAAAGLRSTWGLTGPALTGVAPGWVRLAALVASAGEAYGDKQPAVPDRLGAIGLTPRVATGATGAFLLARRRRTAALFPVLVGMTGAVAGAFAGSRWRRWADVRMPDWQAGLLEDAVTAPVALLACRNTRAADQDAPVTAPVR
jgi:uncharacterized protein YfiM (DUF2279 family)